MYKNFCKIYDIIEVLSSYLDYAHDCMRELFTLGNNSVTYDKYSGKTTIVINDETYLITDIALLPYILYEYYVSSYDNMFDDSLDFYHTFLSVCGVSFKDMASNLDSIVSFRSNFGYKTDDSDIEFLREYFLLIHSKLRELDSL
jgi:hypothetical protein